jgi:hypothetical protein
VKHHHVGLRGEHDHGRVPPIRRKGAAVAEQAEVRSDVLALETGEPDHLDQVSVVDQLGIESLGEDFELGASTLRIAGAQNGLYRPWPVAVRIQARILQQAGRVQQDLPRIGAAIDGAIEQVVVCLAVCRRDWPEEFRHRLVPLNREVGVSLVEQVVIRREQRELKRPELCGGRKEVIERRVDPVDDADSIGTMMPWIDQDGGHRVEADAAVGAARRPVHRNLGIGVAGGVLVGSRCIYRHRGDRGVGADRRECQRDPHADRGFPNRWVGHWVPPVGTCPMTQQALS